MAVLIGNEYMVWVAALGATPTFTLFGGQQEGSIAGSMATGDASHKTSGGYALKIPGLTDGSISLSWIADLPDPGYTVVETAFNTKARVLVEVRGGGPDAGTGDVVYACEMFVTAHNVTLAQNGAVSGSTTFDLAAAPTTPLTLAEGAV